MLICNYLVPVEDQALHEWSSRCDTMDVHFCVFDGCHTTSYNVSNIEICDDLETYISVSKQPQSWYCWLCFSSQNKTAQMYESEKLTTLMDDQVCLILNICSHSLNLPWFLLELLWLSVMWANNVVQVVMVVIFLDSYQWLQMNTSSFSILSRTCPIWIVTDETN